MRSYKIRNLSFKSTKFRPSDEFMSDEEIRRNVFQRTFSTKSFRSGYVSHVANVSDMRLRLVNLLEY